MRVQKGSIEGKARAAGYTRVSTEEQAEGGHSLAAQRKGIRAYCEAKGWVLVEVYSDAGASGKNLRRPGLQNLLAACDEGAVDVVVAAALDRLGRRLRDLNDLRERYFDNGVALALLREGIDCTTPTGKAMYALVATFAELERDLGAERTKVGLVEARAAGKVLGGVPYGWKRNGDGLMRDEAAQRTLRKARRLRRSGHSLRAIGEAVGWPFTSVARRLAAKTPKKSVQVQGVK